MLCSAATAAVVSIVFSSMLYTADGEDGPVPIFPTNEREWKGTLNDISYSVNRFTNPNTKINPNFLERLSRALGAPPNSQPVPVQEPLGVGRLVFSIINWSLNLAKDIKNRRVKIDTVGNGTLVSVSDEEAKNLTGNSNT